MFLRYEFFAVMKVQMLTFWVYMSCNSYSEDGGSKYLKNVG